jgi:hypothetical protein
VQRSTTNSAILVGKKSAGGKLPGSRLLSNASFRKREARAFPPAPSEDMWCGRPRLHTVFLAAQAGYSRRPGRSETQSIIDAFAICDGYKRSPVSSRKREPSCTSDIAALMNYKPQHELGDWAGLLRFQWGHVLVADDCIVRICPVKQPLFHRRSIFVRNAM